MQTEALAEDGQRSASEALQPVLDQIVALSNVDGQSAHTMQPLLRVTYRQLVPASGRAPSHTNVSSIPFPPPSTSKPSAKEQAVTSISSLTDAAVHMAEKVYYDILASRAPTSPSCGDTHEEKLNWIKQRVEEQKRDKKRRRGREPSEYQGRGGRGADDGVTKEQGEEEQDEAREEPFTVVGFFESDSDQNGADEDEDGR